MLTSKRFIPPAAKETMLTNYRAAFRPMDQCGYATKALGTSTDYAFMVAENVWFEAKKVIAIKRDQKRSSGITGPVRVLEFGCGKGGFVKSVNVEFKGEVEATGITAFCPDQTDPAIKQGNFEFPFEIDGIKQNSYDIVISHDSLTHASNPGLCILNGNDALRKDGILLVDCVPLWGLTLAEHKDVISQIEPMFPSYVLTIGKNIPCIAGIFSTKNNALTLPLDYAGVHIEPKFQSYKTKYSYSFNLGDINKLQKPLPVTTPPLLISFSSESSSGNGKALQRALLYFFKSVTDDMSREEINQAEGIKKYIVR